MEPVVLLFGVKPMEALLLKNTLASVSLRAEAPAPRDYGRPLGELAGEVLSPLPGKAMNATLETAVLVFCRVPEERMDRALEAMRRSGVGRDALKAVLTPANRLWNIYLLAGELRREHAAMHRKK